MRLAIVTTICLGWMSGDLLSANEPTLQDVINQVRANEKRTARLEMMIRSEFGNKGVVPAIVAAGKGVSAATTSFRSRVVIQDDLWYLSERSELRRSDGNPEVHSFIAAYDGKSTRTVHDRSKSLTTQPGPIQADRIPRPNTFLYLHWNCPVPLSAFLSARKLRPFDEDISWKVEKEEVVNGLRCVRLRNELSSRGEVQHRAYFWLARDRSFLPVKMESFRPRISETTPVGRNEVPELKEVSRGIWIPWRVRTTSFSPRALQTGTTVVAQQIESTVETAILNPDHSVEFFGDVQFGDEAEKRSGN